MVTVTYTDMTFMNSLLEYYTPTNYEYIYWYRISQNWTINYINKKWDYTKYWKSPKLDAYNYIRIVYNKHIKSISRIKRILEKIDVHQSKVKKILDTGYYQIGSLNLLKTRIEKDILKFSTSTLPPSIKKIEVANTFINDVNDKIDYYFTYYKLLATYYNNISKYKGRYNSRIRVLKGAPICATCFRGDSNTTYITIKRNHKLCKTCNDASLKETEELDCPICLDKFLYKGMENTNCGNGHSTCKNCYDILKKLSTKCPICRGVL